MQRIVRQSLWFITGFFSKYKRLLIASFLLAMGIGVILLGILPHLPKPKQEIYAGIVGKYNVSQVPPQLEPFLGIGLTRMDDKNTPAPGLAAKWDVLDDGKTYRFYLKPNLVWSNGQPLKIDDLNLNISSITVNRTQPNIIEFKLPDAFAPFPSLLDKPIIKDGYLTTGPNTIKDVQTAGPYLASMTLESETQMSHYQFFDTMPQAVTAFKLGAIDQLLGLTEKPDLDGWRNAQVTKEPDFSKYVAIFFNYQDQVVGSRNQDGSKNQDNKKIRQALAYAINDKTFGQPRALSPLSPLSWAYNQTVKDYGYDLNRAKSLLSGIKVNGMTLELSVTPDLLNIADSIKKDWAQLGINTDIKVISARPNNFQVLLMTEDIPNDPDQYTMWHSTQNTNFVRFYDEKTDKALEDGRRTIDTEKRKRIYFDFQRFLLEEAPAIFLYYPLEYTVTRI